MVLVCVVGFGCEGRRTEGRGKKSVERELAVVMA